LDVFKLNYGPLSGFIPHVFLRLFTGGPFGVGTYPTPCPQVYLATLVTAFHLRLFTGGPFGVGASLFNVPQVLPGLMKIRFFLSQKWSRFARYFVWSRFCSSYKKQSLID